MALFEPPLAVEEVSSSFPQLRVVSVVQSGGQGAVFRATEGTRESALKIYGVGTEFVRVQREIELLEQLRSEHVVKLFSYGTVRLRGADLPYTVTEFVPGEDLSKAQIEWTDSTIRSLLADISRGIEALWEHKVVHRDLKPMNILRRTDGTFVIIDLGLAKFMDRSVVTAQGFVLGTLGYMSPEQCSARRSLTFRSDLFALGVVAYEMAAGAHPFLRQQGLVGAFTPRPLNEVSRVSRETALLIEKMLSRDPIRRPRFCRDIYSQC